ncbi:hypothetical protein P7K49_017534 [Saguinus oedipus]|uniref:dUTPase-like domain-containing protein n=1 Tax=Saguinus oedipus TaxID=9490 RepID=A0ABQ9V2T3_SAGOE|nr:hypothetical protein P7K49_017534 [Saguinus oedipus]
MGASLDVEVSITSVINCSFFEVKKGDRIAQLICERIFYPEIEEVQGFGCHLGLSIRFYENRSEDVGHTHEVFLEQSARSATQFLEAQASVSSLLVIL